MGRFDALTQIEAVPETKPPSPAVASTPPKKPPKSTEDERIENDKMSTNPQTVKPTNQSPTLHHTEKPEKYTTHLEPSMVKQIKLIAVQKDLKDYEVVKNALLLYFGKNK